MTSEREAVKLAERIEAWQHRLGYLGLSHWRIDAVHVVDETPGGPDANATVRASYHYNSCEFWFKHDYVDTATDEQIDESIVHEWLHAFFRDYDRAIESVEGQLSYPVREVWEDRVTHEGEAVIEGLARQIVALYKAEVVP